MRRPIRATFGSESSPPATPAMAHVRRRHPLLSQQARGSRKTLAAAAAGPARSPQSPATAAVPRLSTQRQPRGSARRSGVTTTPRCKSSPAPPPSRAARRRCTGRWPGWALREKKVTAGVRARPAGVESRASGLASRAPGSIRPGWCSSTEAAAPRQQWDRTHGRGSQRRACRWSVPHGHWKVITLTAAVRLGGVPESACLAFPDGATDAACFEAYVGQCLAPRQLAAGDIVVMDNLACHKTTGVARLIAAAGAGAYLPP